MVDRFESEAPTNPDTNRSKVALLDVYDVAKRAVDLGTSNQAEIVAMRKELKAHLRRDRLPAVAMWVIAGGMWCAVIVLTLLAFTPHASAFAR